MRVLQAALLNVNSKQDTVKKEYILDLFGISFHFFKGHGFSLLLREIVSTDESNRAYSIFLVVNFMGLGFAVSNYTNSMSIQSKTP